MLSDLGQRKGWAEVQREIYWLRIGYLTPTDEFVLHLDDNDDMLDG